jgi:hypothetical protein
MDAGGRCLGDDRSACPADRDAVVADCVGENRGRLRRRHEKPSVYAGPACERGGQPSLGDEDFGNAGGGLTLTPSPGIPGEGWGGGPLACRTLRIRGFASKKFAPTLPSPGVPRERGRGAHAHPDASPGKPGNQIRDFSTCINFLFLPRFAIFNPRLVDRLLVQVFLRGACCRCVVHFLFCRVNFRWRGFILGPGLGPQCMRRRACRGAPRLSIFFQGFIC